MKYKVPKRPPTQEATCVHRTKGQLLFAAPSPADSPAEAILATGIIHLLSSLPSESAEAPAESPISKGKAMRTTSAATNPFSEPQSSSREEVVG